VSITATLTYHATAAGPTSPAKLEAAMAAIPLDPGPIEQATGAVLNSDVTSILGFVATRTIIFGIASAQFQGSFPIGTDQAAPFRGLYAQALSAGLNTKISEDPVIII
jgi:hypothetical protein